MKVWHKILVAPAVAIVFLVLFGVVSYVVLNRQNSALADLKENRFASYQLVAHAEQAVSEVHSNVYRLLTWLGNLKEDKVKLITEEQKARIKTVAKQMSDFGARADLDPEERKAAETIVKKLAKYEGDVDMAIDLSTADAATGMSAMQTADAGFQSLLKDMNQLVDSEKGFAQVSYDRARSAFAAVLVMLVAILVVAVAVSGGVAVFMSRTIVRPLREAISAADRIAGGDLASNVDATGSDETADLMRALSNMNASLAKIVGEVRVSTDTIGTASREIAAGNQDLSQRTEEQASSLEETASSMEQLSSTVRQNADNARQANQLAASASEIAVKGGAVVGDVVSTMGAISQSSKKIADIIGVIDGIAFQTNILALNAAVEAARAGEQGRGFAVVAGEVRNLAQRSAAAAKEIKALIEDSVGKVDSGTKLVDQAGQTMEEVVSSIKRVTDIMAEITAASQEQSSGIEQVNQAVTQMDQVTQQNAALVEEAAAAAESMQQQAHQLAGAVAVFKLDASQAKAAVTAKPVASARKAPLVERRGPNRAKNVTRLPAASAKPASVAKSGTDDEWTEF